MSATPNRARWTLVALALLAAIAAADALAGRSAVLGALVVLAPMLAAARSGPRGTALVAGCALVLAVVLGIPDGSFGRTEHIDAVLIVAAGGALSIWSAGLRRRHEQALVRLATQTAVTRILAESPTLEEATPRLLAAAGATLGWELGAIWEVRDAALH